MQVRFPRDGNRLVAAGGSLKKSTWSWTAQCESHLWVCPEQRWTIIAWHWCPHQKEGKGSASQWITRKSNRHHFPWHKPPAVLRQQMGKLVNIQLYFPVIQEGGSAEQFHLIKIFEVMWYCSPLSTKFRLITCRNVSKTVNYFWFLCICVIRFSQPLVLKPIDFEIITKAPLKNCHVEVKKNLRETTDLANYRE